MSDKPRVYQGVRVKTTVKELLQRHRAREANSKKVKTTSQACFDLPDLCPSPFPNRYVDPPPAVPLAADSNSCAARSIQLRTASFPFPDSSCNIQMQESTFDDIQQQLGDMMLPSNGFNVSNNNHSSTVGGGGCSASLPPLSTLPLPWCHGLSSDADYYGQEMAPCSSPEYLKHCNPMDPNSYSPQDSFSSSSSSCYDSPTRMESSYHGGFASEHYHYQNCNLQDCYCLPHCWPSQQESFSAPEYVPHYNPTDYPYACPAEESYLRRDLQMSSEMCYNVL
ncbi:colorectal cancer associated 2 [Labrus bergylta]|uniref:colorectal cancer associated 2 n=1 Tax=Labrus bergylta TaxID=56723 RepID=UPI0009B4AC47|nr:colorectal cancer-associated protein 2 [Labrus bergylta]